MKLYWLILPLLCSCSVYKDRFDCPVSVGLKCKSVTQIEGMIREKEEGPDCLVIPKKGKEKQKKLSSKAKSYQAKPQRTKIKDCIEPASKKKNNVCPLKKLGNIANVEPDREGEIIMRKPPVIKRVWMNGFVDSSGCYVGGHYLFFAVQEDEWIVVNKNGRKCS